MKKKSPPKTHLESLLQKTTFSFNSYLNKIRFNKKVRTYGQMAEAFGITVRDSILRDKVITHEDVEIFKNQVETLLKEKYGTRLLESETKVAEGMVQTIRSPILEETSEADTSETDEPSTFQPKYKDQKATLLIKYCNQEKVARELWNDLEKGIRGQLLLATTGSGKTYILASIIKNFIEQGYIKKYNSVSPWPILYVTKASIVAQTQKVLKNEFGIKDGVRVCNIEMLRSELGSFFVKDKVTVRAGVESIEYEWLPWMHPLFFIWDECQILARETSIQAKIAQAVNKIEDEQGVPIFQISASATPFSRVGEGKHFACSTRAEFEFGLQTMRITDKTWTTFASTLTSDPYEYSEASIKRFIDFFEGKYIKRIKNIRPQFKTYNRVQRITFQTKEEREEYDKAWEHYQERKAKIEGNEKFSESQGTFALLAEFTIFRKAAEKIRRFHLAKFAVTSFNSGKQPAIACAFKGTITGVYKILIEDYNWTRDDISIIWGGATESLSDKAKILKRFREDKDFAKAMQSVNLNLADLGVDEESIILKTGQDLEFEKKHNLLTQKPEDRERERMRYQRGESKLLLFSYKSGGVGLSAHHEAQYPNARPREGIFTPVYSEKELIQAFGRLPRITSISDTSQTMCYYGGTIEEHVAARVIMKLKCMKEVVRARESWEDIITGKPTQIEEDSMMEDEGGILIGDYKE